MERSRAGSALLTRFDRAAFGFLRLLLALAFAYLFLYSLVFTSVIDSSNAFAEHILRQRDSVWQNLLLVFGIGLLLHLVLRLEGRLPLRLLTGLVLGWVFAASCAWVCAVQASPRGDAATLYALASEINKSGLSPLAEGDALYYFRSYPFQLGYLAYSMLVQRVFGSPLAVGVLNAAFLTGAYGAVLMITWHCFHDRRVQLCTLLLLGLCLQPMLYCSFLYGSVPGLCLALWAVVCLMRWMRERGALPLAGGIALLCMAVLLKPNYLIFAIALAIVVVLHAVGSRRFVALLAALALLILPPLVQKANQRIFEQEAGVTFGSGTPQTAWLAMGLQEGSRAAGWYNQYTYHLLEACDFDTDAASAQVQKDISERLSVFAAAPGYALSFFHSKLTSQWSETTFESLWISQIATNLPSRPAWVRSMVEGPASAGLARYMEGYTLLLYACFACGLLLAFGKKPAWREAFGLCVLLVVVFGGFLYHMLFEAKSQYLFIYLPLMVPFAARALSMPLPVKRRRAP